MTGQWRRGQYPALWADVADELALFLSRPHAEEFEHLRGFLDARQGDPEPAGPLLIDLVAGSGHVDRLMDAYLHYANAAVPLEDVSLRRLRSYSDNLEDFLRTDQNVYGWPREG